MSAESFMKKGVFEAIFCLLATAIIGNFVSLKYILKDLKVSKHVTKVLSFGSLLGIFLPIVSWVNTGIIYIHETKNVITCGFAADTTVFLFVSNICTSMTLSILRQYMARTVGENKVIDDQILRRRLNLALVIQFLVIFGGILLSTCFGINLTIIASNCNPNGSPSLLPFFASWSIFAVMTTFYHDVKLFLFVKEYNEKTKGQMKKWSFQASNKEEIEEIVSTSIPLISLLFTIGVGTLVSILISMVPIAYGDADFTQINLIFVDSMNVFYMPLIITLAMKKQSKKTDSEVYIPKGLHFHQDVENEEDNDDEEDVEDENKSKASAEIHLNVNKSEILLIPEEFEKNKVEPKAIKQSYIQEKQFISQMKENHLPIISIS